MSLGTASASQGVVGPYEVGMLNGQVVTGYGYEARSTAPATTRAWFA